MKANFEGLHVAPPAASTAPGRTPHNITTIYITTLQNMGNCQGRRSAEVVPYDESEHIQRMKRRRKKRQPPASKRTDATDILSESSTSFDYEVQEDPVNASIIRRLLRDDPSFRILTVSSMDIEHLFLNSFCPKSSKDLEVLGECLATNTHLRELHIIMLDNVQLETDRMFKWLALNRTLQSLRLSCTDLLGGAIFGMLAPFFKNNSSLDLIVVDGCSMGKVCDLMLSMAVEGNSNPKLKVLVENQLNKNASVKKDNTFKIENNKDRKIRNKQRILPIKRANSTSVSSTKTEMACPYEIPISKVLHR